MGTTKWQGTDSDNYKLVMNKTATHTRIGHILTEENIVDESQFNLFVLRNLKNNLFDPRDYQEVIQYFREPIRAFDYSKIFNNFVNKLSDEGDEDDDDGDNYEDYNDDDNDKEEYVEYGKEQETSRVANAEKRSINEQGDQQQSDMGEELAHDDNDEEKYDSVELENSSRSFVESSESESESSLIGNNETSIVSRSGKRITYLRILYEWLRGLYSIQMRSVSKSTGCLSSSLKRLNRTPPASTPKQHNSNSNNQAARRHLWLFRRRTFCARKSSTTPSTT
jgi:hypothetical protein